MNATTESEHTDILLVEDNPGDVRLAEEAFKSNGDVTLHVVHDGFAALDFLFQRDEYADSPLPDLVLLDLNLPRKNGDEVLEEIEAEPTLRKIPIVVLTSSQAREDIARSYDRSANAYLTKPVDPDSFIDVIQSIKRFWLSTVELPRE